MPSVDDGAPELAVVILSVASPPELRSALESLQRQAVPLEIVVVNSGGGDVESVLAELGSSAKVVSVPHRLWPGAARNVGIRATKAPWIAFMASDHIATDGWAQARLERHRAGYQAVACAVINSHPRNLVAWACHLAILVRRLPGVPEDHAGLYGVSYARALFERYGEFREDLRIGEDTDFNSRLAAGDGPIWAPEIQTIHLNITSVRALLKDQFARGRRSGLHGPGARGGSLLRPTLERFSWIAKLSYRSVRGLDRWFVVACWPILLIGVFSHGFGFRAGYRERMAQQEQASE